MVNAKPTEKGHHHAELRRVYQSCKWSSLSLFPVSPSISACHKIRWLQRQASSQPPWPPAGIIPVTGCVWSLCLSLCQREPVSSRCINTGPQTAPCATPGRERGPKSIPGPSPVSPARLTFSPRRIIAHCQCVSVHPGTKPGWKNKGSWDETDGHQSMINSSPNVERDFVHLR